MRILVFLFFSATTLFGDGQELYHRILNADNGLASNKVHYVYEDSKGFIWFGTENGACRWDSKNFVTYTIKDGLPNNEVLIIYEDSKGRIWFSTFSNELCYLYHDTIFNTKNDKRLEKISIIKGGKLCEHKGEIYYFNYPSSMPEKYNLQTLENSKTGIKSLAAGNPHISFFKQDLINSSSFRTPINMSYIFLDSIIYSFYNWQVYITSEFKDSFKLIDNFTKKFYSIPLGSLPCFLQNHSANPISYNTQISATSYLSYTTKQNLYHIKLNSTPLTINNKFNCEIKFLGEFNGDLHDFHFLNNELLLDYKSHIQSQNGSFIPLEFQLNHAKIINHKLAIITDNNTLLVTNIKVQNIRIPKLKQIPIYKLFHWNNELNILYQNGMKYNLAKKSYTKIEVNGTALYNLDRGENDQMFLTSFSKIINLFSGEELTSEFPYQSASYKGFSYSSKHHFYTICNSRNGLYTLDLKRKSRKISDLNTYVSYIDSRDRLWLGSINKLYLANTFLPQVTGKKEVILNPKFDVFCSEIKEDNRGNIFFTTNNGIYILDKNNRKYQLFDKNYLSSNECVTLKLDTQNQSFIVATRNGVNHIHYATQNGILVFNVVNKLFKDDGLGSNEISDILIQGDSLWIATARGLSLIINKNYRPDSIKIPVHFNKIFINDSLWRLDTFYNLNHTQNNLKIDYSAIYYQRRERLDINYRLIKDGDTTQGKIENSILQLFSLAPGSYTLQIYAFDRDYPYIHSDYRTLRFEISPPYYKTWWFYSLILLGALSIFGGLMWYRYKNKLEQVKLVSELNKYKLQGLQNQMNPHFVFNSMSTIQDLILTEQNVDALDFISDFSHLMRTMLQNSRNETISLTQEINFLKRYIELEQIRYSQTFDYKFETEIPEEELNDIYIPTMMIQPIIENAIKHGVSNLKERRGQVKIYLSLDSEETYLTVNVIDNGQGKSSSSKSKNHTSTAINVIQERLNIYTKNNKKGEYNVEYSDTGTKAELILPI